jgi:hypothetical protein
MELVAVGKDIWHVCVGSWKVHILKRKYGAGHFMHKHSLG